MKHLTRGLAAGAAGLLLSAGLALPASAAVKGCSVSINDASVDEGGDGGTTPVTFDVTIAPVGGGNCNNVAVQYAFADETATQGADYTGAGGTLTFTNQTPLTQQITASVLGDTAVEGDETFAVNLTSTSANVTFTDMQGIGTILGDDVATPVPAVTVNDPSVTEGDSGTTAGAFTFTLSGPASSDVTIGYAIEAGSAAATTDYTVAAPTGTVTIPAGSLTATVPFDVVGDDTVETNETFILTVTSVTAGATKGDDGGTATIVDDDEASATGGTGMTGENGYRMVAADGGIFTFGERTFRGSTGDLTLNKPIVGGATDLSDYDGYWIVASDGGVFTFNAEFYGSLGGENLPAPAVEIEPIPSGKGYFIVLANGKVFTFGDANFAGDMSGKALNKPIIGMSVTPTGKGYWLVAEDGGIFNFGDAGFFGSMGDQKLNAPVIDLAPAVDNKGYYLLGLDGGVFTFGSADFKGSTGNITLNAPVIAMLVNPTGSGYWLAATDGGIFTFGPGAEFLGSMGGTKLNSPVLDLIN